MCCETCNEGYTVVTVPFQQHPVVLDPSIHMFCSQTRIVTSTVGLSEVKTLNVTLCNTYSIHVRDHAVGQVNRVKPCKLLRDPLHFFYMRSVDHCKSNKDF